MTNQRLITAIYSIMFQVKANLSALHSDITNLTVPQIQGKGNVKTGNVVNTRYAGAQKELGRKFWPLPSFCLLNS